MKPLVTIATVTFNCLEYTKLFLESIKNFADVPYKLIVVDNHSTDGTAEFLSHQKNIQVIFNKRNLGFGWGNNQAFKLCQTPYFLGLNNDVFIFPHFLSTLLKIAEENPKFSEFGVHSNCLGAIDPRTGKDKRVGLEKLAKEGNSPKEIVEEYYRDYGKFFQQFSQRNQGILEMEVPPNFIGGWCFLVKTEAVRKAGGLFDRRFKVGFWEDVDLSWRLSKIGGKIGLAKGIYLHHFSHVSFKENKLRLSDHALSRTNALRFGEKWSEEIKFFLREKFRKELTIKEIVKKYFIFQVFFGLKRDDFAELEEDLKKIIFTQASFKDFLLLYPRK